MTTPDTPRTATPVKVDYIAAPPGLSKAEIAYQKIRGRIVSHELAPGHRLTLSTLATDLDMSVVPVREAIRRLEAEGLATFERNIGAKVAMVDESAYTHSMQCLGLLEGAATSKSAPYLTAQDLQEAKDLNAQLEALLEDFDPKAFTEINHRFHQKLCSACPNDRLLELVEAEWSRLGNLRESTFSFIPARAAQSVAEHAEIIRLIESGASENDIERAARDHRKATLASYLTSKEPQLTSP
ncbi:GntR family transcriptional regulator [Rothia nasimurium]|uniref:GntR family transcriptional regulator n=1 Tax=Rothia nasimurium TaxID=85336 RepID=UPI003B9F03D6